MLRRVGAPPFFAGLNGPIVGHLRPHVPVADVVMLAEPPLADRGSAWSVAPARTGTGAPVVAGLALAPLDHPSARYLVHLKAPGWNVIGVTAPWRPGVVAGHNEHIAWSFVPTPADTQDVFVERLNPSNARERWTPDGWRPVTVATAAVAVKGRDTPFESEQLFTPHGSVVAIDRERHLAYAVSWVGREAGTAAELGALRLGRSTSWADFREALRSWKLPAAEFVYADVEGHIGWHAAGLVPRRADGEGALPSAGWTSRGAWRGLLPHDRQPWALDPPVGYALASPGATRRLRLESLLATQGIDVETAARIQHDVVSASAERLIPLLATVMGGTAAVEAARRHLMAWDRQVTARSVDAPLFAAWHARLLSTLAQTRIPAGLAGEFVPRAAARLVDAVVEASATWFDGDRRAARDRLLVEALAAAVDDLNERTGSSASLPWARFRTAVFAHPLGLSDQARRRFDLGPFELAGSAETLAATGRSSGRMLAPVVRLSFDLADWDRSRALIVPGQSGAPDSPHVADLADIWARGDDVPLVFSERAVADAAQSTLTLVPRR
jgi:penicillin amidase